MTTTPPNAQSIFGRALEIESPAGRATYLDEACGPHAGLRSEVEGLLAAAEKAGEFMKRPAAAELTAGCEPLTDGPGTIIGPYKLLHQLGEGGFGVVFMAEQDQPIRRKVAFKIIKPGMDSKQVVARFEAERHALALMDHPNIARVLDGGTTATGRPYFVMELVKGIPITEFCDQNRLTPRERLELFIPVCQAVQHAHQKGVIHRDLKPSNVLVTMYDDKPVPKVIDFGVAKAIEQKLTEQTLFTRVGQIVGTVEYMSPEQATLNALDVDTRSDIYSLGVLLYELLTGTTPLDKNRLQGVAFLEMLRRIREEEPPRPSTRLSESGDALTAFAVYRRTETQRLPALIKGELDWIALKALEKDRTRRYQSANALAADVQRYLKDEQVEACPPTTGYRLRKFARKNKSLLATAAAFAALLLLGVAASAWQAVRATEAEAVAVVNEQKAKDNAAQAEQKEKEAKDERDEAQRKRDEIQALNQKLQATLKELRATQKKLRSTLYAAHINLAQRAWESGGPERVRELLELQRPKIGETDLRNFEWNYLYRLSHRDLLTLKGFTGRVVSVAYSPDGKRLATGSGGDGPWGVACEVKVWDAQTGQELVSLKGAGAPKFGPDGKRLTWPGRGSEIFVRGNHAGAHVAFSPDGKRLVCASVNQVKVWDTQTGKELLDIREVNSLNVNAVAFSPDGKRLACGVGGGESARVMMWDAQTGAQLLVIKVKGRIPNLVTSVAFSPDGKRLVTASLNNTMKVWDAQTGKPLLTLTGDGDSVGFSPDGKLLAGTCKDQAVKVWDAQTGKDLLTLMGHTGTVWSVAFSQDSKRLASASDDKTVKVWDAQTGQQLFTHKGHSAAVWSASFSPDGNHLVSHSGDNTVKVWDSRQEGADGQAPRGRAGDNIVKVWDGRAEKLETPVQKPRPLPFGRPYVKELAFSSDGKRLATYSWPGMVKLWDIQTGRELDAVQVTNVFRWDLKRLADAKVWDAQTCKLLLPGRGRGGRGEVSSSDGKRLAGIRLPGNGATLVVWDAQTGQELLFLKHNSPVASFAFSPDGKLLASGVSHHIRQSSPGEVKVWDTQTGKELLTLKGHTDDVKCVVFSPDGKRLASASSDNTMKVWDAQTGKELVTLKGHSGGLTALTYSPDGNRLASTSRDKTLRVWDAQTGQELLALEGHGGPVNVVAFSPDGRRLVSGTEDCTVRIWDATPLPGKRKAE